MQTPELWSIEVASAGTGAQVPWKGASEWVRTPSAPASLLHEVPSASLVVWECSKKWVVNPI